MIKELTVICDDSIIDSLNKKHQEVFGNINSDFEKTINELSSKVKIPFIDEIKQIHSSRNKVEQNQEIDIEEASHALRTAKNFLSIFNQ